MQLCGVASFSSRFHYSGDFFSLGIWVNTYVWMRIYGVQILREKRWKDVTATFNFPSTATNASFVLRKYYYSLLQHYERIYYFKAQDQSAASAGMIDSMLGYILDHVLECGSCSTKSVLQVFCRLRVQPLSQSLLDLVKCHQHRLQLRLQMFSSLG